MSQNRLLVLYAFDIVHTDPSDPFDLGLGFNRGIADNDRGRRGAGAVLSGSDALPSAAGLTAEALAEAVDSLRSALKGDLGGLLGGAVDDAHRRLFPLDSLGPGQRPSQRLTEQHLRDLLLLEGGAEAYLAAKSATVRNRGGGGGARGGGAKPPPRRRGRGPRVGGGGGFYSVSGGEGASGISRSQGIRAGAAGADFDPEAGEFYDDAVSPLFCFDFVNNTHSSSPSVYPPRRRAPRWASCPPPRSGPQCPPWGLRARTGRLVCSCSSWC
jgi:hypothetical protein